MVEHKGYNIVPDGTFGMKFIRGIGKGALPVKLKGSFTNTPMAIKAIDQYLSAKGVKNGKDDSAG